MGYFLLGYNLVQFFAWSTLFLASAATGTLAYQQAYISTLLKFVQVSMMVEVIYIKVFRSLLKISKSPLGPTAVQVIGRIWFIYGIMDVVPNSLWAHSVIIMWSISDIIRFLNYLFLELGTVPHLVSWLRYSAFIVLYPIEFSSEILTIRDAYSIISQCCPRIYSIEMPNPYNISFDYLYFIWIVAAPGYFFGCPFLYSYMLQQRKRRITKIE